MFSVEFFIIDIFCFSAIDLIKDKYSSNSLIDFDDCIIFKRIVALSELSKCSITIK